jgi:uncharacterized membrane protein YkvA (DUF1232 family)
MSAGDLILTALGVFVVGWVVFLVVLIASGRREEARALARFIPDCVVLLRRLVAEDEVSGRMKLLLALTIGYLVFPIDVVPDFIPILGHLDDALLLMWTLRALVRQVPPERLAELWPGPSESLAAVQRLANRGRGAGAP